ncbi:hypothetical protein LWC34_44120 [Kibdelosporangium philippinense]|uniref:Uncharacterized protein n=1 Tax=Kibdelosporangium philippinense TaxID=211113 RepID=A0ABS8ZPS4_9PSEU|nr:hypothetical protein [Kibdelosporangium philippinense]MCE7009751.1 hypothetical protein [Kibdelosporangium philippinense]
MRKFTKRVTVALVALVVGALAMGGVAYAFPSFFGGTTATIQRDITETAFWNTPLAATWHTVPSTAIGVTVPAGEARIVESTFGAESSCIAANQCSVRVVYIPAGGAPVEFSPVVGTDFAFDSPSGGPREQHSIHRVTRLGPGSYTILVQAQIVGAGGGALFQLDDYTHFVDLINP